jgi:hypothetical protein
MSIQTTLVPVFTSVNTVLVPVLSSVYTTLFPTSTTSQSTVKTLSNCIDRGIPFNWTFAFADVVTLPRTLVKVNPLTVGLTSITTDSFPNVAVNARPVTVTVASALMDTESRLMLIGDSNTGIEILPLASVPTLLRTVFRANPVRVKLASAVIVSFPKLAVKPKPVNETLASAVVLTTSSTEVSN